MQASGPAPITGGCSFSPPLLLPAVLTEGCHAGKVMRQPGSWWRAPQKPQRNSCNVAAFSSLSSSHSNHTFTHSLPSRLQVMKAQQGCPCLPVPPLGRVEALPALSCECWSSLPSWSNRRIQRPWVTRLELTLSTTHKFVLLAWIFSVMTHLTDRCIRPKLTLFSPLSFCCFVLTCFPSYSSYFYMIWVIPHKNNWSIIWLFFYWETLHFSFCLDKNIIYSFETLNAGHILFMGTNSRTVYGTNLFEINNILSLSCDTKSWEQRGKRVIIIMLIILFIC